jgi:molybdopterin converting factor small subunit
MSERRPKVRVQLPSSLRTLAGGKAELGCEGRTVGEVLEALARLEPALGARLVDEQGRARRYVSLFLGDEDVRQLGGLGAPVRDGDVLTVVPAIAGGAPCR